MPMSVMQATDGKGGQPLADVTRRIAVCPDPLMSWMLCSFQYNQGPYSIVFLYNFKFVKFINGLQSLGHIIYNRHIISMG